MKALERELRVFIPENFPLENKGEEAILRGIEDMLSQSGLSVLFCTLPTTCNRKKIKGNVIMYPHEWIHSSWYYLTFQPGFSFPALYSTLCCICRHILNRFLPNWIKIMPLPLRLLIWLEKDVPWLRKLFPERYEMLQELKKMDIVIAGHDGVFRPREYHILNFMRDMGLVYGIIGCSLKPGNPKIARMYEKSFSNSLFLYFREKFSYEWVQEQLPSLKKSAIAPDPAFAMRPVETKEVDSIIKKEKLDNIFLMPVVMMTVTENVMIKRFAFKDKQKVINKIRAHRYLMANLVQHIIDEWNASIIFLPHSTGITDELEDRRIAKEIMKLVKNPMNRVKIIYNEEYGARQLKGLIGRADLLIGERVHSIIGAVGVNTPFVCIGSKNDFRITGIIGNMCQCSDCLYYLESAALETLCAFADSIWKRKEAIRERLKNVSSEMQAQLSGIGNEILAYVKSGMKINERSF
ncbi:polysaccharide pyruvyl transferase family protein [candidate division WOR-3 bacterium]|nr:polysaccharide pyruvyl transferase family protein [candidate division WOR-3 bacterium]